MIEINGISRYTNKDNTVYIEVLPVDHVLLVRYGVKYKVHTSDNTFDVKTIYKARKIVSYYTRDKLKHIYICPNCGCADVRRHITNYSDFICSCGYDFDRFGKHQAKH